MNFKRVIKWIGYIIGVLILIYILILGVLIYLYFSSMTRLLISSLYSPIDNDIDMKVPKYPNISSFFIFTRLFYNTLLDVFNYNIRALDTDKMLISYIKHKKGTSVEVPLCYSLLESCIGLI